MSVDEEGFWHGRRLITFLLVQWISSNSHLRKYSDKSHAQQHSINHDTICKEFNWKNLSHSHRTLRKKWKKKKLEKKKEETYVHAHNQSFTRLKYERDIYKPLKCLRLAFSVYFSLLWLGTRSYKSVAPSRRDFPKSMLVLAEIWEASRKK